MKKVVLIGLFVGNFTVNMTFAQVINHSQVPSVIINHFQQKFIKVSDVEWEMEGENYKVDFETGTLGTDHTVWYGKTGEIIKHKQDISKSNLPQNVQKTLESNFKGYRVEDVEKITEGNTVTYNLELKSFTEEWKVVINSEGKMLNKIAD